MKEPVVDEIAAFEGFDESRRTHDREVLRNGGDVRAHELAQLAHALFPFAEGDHHAKSARVAERLEEFRLLLKIVFGHPLFPLVVFALRARAESANR